MHPSSVAEGLPGRGRAPDTFVRPLSVLRVPARVLDAQAWWWWGLALVPFALVVVLPHFAGPGVDSDDYGQYLMHAQALASGRSYGQIDYLWTRYNEFIGPASTLPGLPLLLAPVLRLGGVALVPWAMLLVALAFPVLAGLYFARREQPALALLAAVVAVLSPAIVFNATQALTDLPFATAVWGMALVADRPGRVGWGRILALTTLGGAAMLLRTAAAPIVPALLITALARRRADGLRLAVPVLIWAVVGVALLSLMQLSRLLLVHADFGRMLSWSIGSGRMRLNGVAYARAMLDAHFQTMPGGALSLALRLLALGITGVGTVSWLRRHPDSFLAIFAVLYGLMLLVLPFKDDRYLWPLLPLTTFGLLDGIRMLAARLGRGRTALRAALAAAVLLAVLGVTTTALARRPIALADQPDGHQLFAYLGDLAARQPVRFTFMKPRMLAWTLHVPVMGSFIASQPQTLRELCAKRITHVVTSRVSRDHDGPLRALADSRPDLFTLTFANPTYRVYRFSGGCPAAPAGAGADVARP